MSEIYNPQLERYAQKENPLPPLEDVDKLIAERDELEERVEEYNYLKGYRILTDVPKKLVYNRFDELVERISGETKLVDEIEDTVSKANLLRNKGERTFPTQVAFGQEDVINSETEEGSKTLGSYSRKENKIRIAADEPNKKRLWFDLTFEGMPQVIRTLDHEITHFWYGKAAKSKNRIGKLKGFLADLEIGLYNRIVDEAAKASKGWDRFKAKFSSVGHRPDVFFKVATALHDMRIKRYDVEINRSREPKIKSEVVAQKAGRVFEKRENTTRSLLRTLAESYGYKEPGDIDLIITTSQVVDRLRVLGFVDKEIATKLARAKYDRATSSFPELEEEISSLAESRGARVEDLDTRVDVRRLKYQTENLKAQIIAQEELEKLGKEVRESEDPKQNPLKKYPLIPKV